MDFDIDPVSGKVLGVKVRAGFGVAMGRGVEVRAGLGVATGRILW